VDEVLESLDPFGDESLEAPAVAVGEEEVIAAVAAEHDMVERSRRVDAWLSGHAAPASQGTIFREEVGWMRGEDRMTKVKKSSLTPILKSISQA
jgi:hypothetical protein